jgi:serine protease inhibitor
MDNFLDTINGWIEETESRIDETLQTIVLKIGETVVTLSPVDTGRFKGNWQLGIDQTTSESLIRYDQEGFATLSEMAQKVNSFTAGQIAYIQNHVLYGYDLEYGSSKQAPDGVVRITAQRFTRIVNEAVALHREP